MREFSMDIFQNELESEEIHFRDKWQFELKSEFTPNRSTGTNNYTQEFYIFIPNSLKINTETYSKQEFYQNETNFFRYKTPVFTFAELNDPQNTLSPLTRIINLGNKSEKAASNAKEIEYELKLLGNIVRSLLRKQTLCLWKSLQSINTHSESENFTDEIDRLCGELSQFRSLYSMGKEKVLLQATDHNQVKHFTYVEEFIGNSVEYYFTGLLKEIMKHPLSNFRDARSKLIEVIAFIKEKNKGFSGNNQNVGSDPNTKEYVLYRAGLLNKYVLDPLLLNITRTSPEKRIQNFIGSCAAGFAMLVYFGLFVWQTQVFAQVFLLHTELFILATVVLYILKDRLKEGIKAYSYRLASKWYPDYTTEIRSYNDEVKLGYFKESFSFITPNQIPNIIKEVRNKEFHYILEDFARPENVLYYKKTIEMLHPDGKKISRKYSLNSIFQFSIHRFLEKAEDAYQTYLSFDEKTETFNYLTLPKVYHINIILKNSFTKEDGSIGTELKKFRLIVDKEGIKRVEHIYRS